MFRFEKLLFTTPFKNEITKKTLFNFSEIT